jgi:nitrite reductase (NADH) large subunit
MMKDDVLIIGAGPAGLNAAKAARRSGKQVVLAGAEPFPPYWRPRLPELIHTNAAVGDILMQKEEWFSSAGIQFVPSAKAVCINPAEKTAIWENGKSSEYGSLILACGSFPNMPSVPFVKRIYPLRSYSDALEIRRSCAQTHKAFVVGGGVLGLEAAFAVSQMGAKVSVYDISDYPLPRQLDRDGGLFLKKLLEKKGITIYGGGAMEQFREEAEGSCVIAAVGVRPSISLAEKCGIKTNRGILVDDHMRTSADSVYACGDVAEFSGAVPGLMTVAAKQGEIAGLNASGTDAVYHAVVPSPMTKVAGISVLSIGTVKAAEGVQFYRKSGEESYAVAAVAAGKIVGAAFINHNAPGTKFKKWIEEGTAIGRVYSYDEIEKRLS